MALFSERSRSPILKGFKPYIIVKISHVKRVIKDPDSCFSTYRINHNKDMNKVNNDFDLDITIVRNIAKTNKHEIF